MDKFKIVCETCNATTNDFEIDDGMLIIKCSQCGNRESSYCDWITAEELGIKL